MALGTVSSGFNMCILTVNHFEYLLASLMNESRVGGGPREVSSSLSAPIHYK